MGYLNKYYLKVKENITDTLAAYQLVASCSNMFQQPNTDLQ